MEIMQPLNKYNLEFAPSWEYALENLKNINTLSIELLKVLGKNWGRTFIVDLLV
jgi:hypothetical protein